MDMDIDLRKHIREVPGFPHEGIIFRDITTLLIDPALLRETIRQLEERLQGLEFDLIAGPESRGFIFSMPLAHMFNVGFVPVRKAGKLPAETVSKEYALEYGAATIEIHKDAIKPGSRVIIVDDLLATGGTCKAVCELVESQGGVVTALLFLIELEDLGGRELLKGYDVRSVARY